MISQYLMVAILTLATLAPHAKPWERFDGCKLEPDEWTDGDSFRVRLPDRRLETFRLYYVDTTESRSRGQRSDEQAAYFGLTRAGAIELGKEAKAFTATMLSEPFTIWTRWRPVFGPTRYYAFVYTAQGEDLAELLVRRGLARIYGTRTPTPDGTDSRQYRAKLLNLENQAKSEKLGGWRRSPSKTDQLPCPKFTSFLFSHRSRSLAKSMSDLGDTASKLLREKLDEQASIDRKLYKRFQERRAQFEALTPFVRSALEEIGKALYGPNGLFFKKYHMVICRESYTETVRRIGWHLSRYKGDPRWGIVSVYIDSSEARFRIEMKEAHPKSVGYAESLSEADLRSKLKEMLPLLVADGYGSIR